MPLRISATVELVSLAILFGNMATADVHGIAALVGPVHGIAWLFGIVATWRDPNRTTGIAVRAVIPGIGGMLALRALDRADSHSPKPSTSADPADFSAGPSDLARWRSRHQSVACSVPVVLVDLSGLGFRPRK